MSITTIKGQQLRDATVARSKIDATFEAGIALLESQVQTIFNTMSTDQERMDAIAAVTAAWQAADGSLQTMITNMVNATKVGAGLEADGSFALPVGQNYLTGATSLKSAVGLLDAALKAEETARIAADAALQSSLQSVIDSGATSTQAAIAAEETARIAGDAALQASLTAETTARTDADTAMQLALDNEVAARQDLNTTLSTSIANEANARTAADSAEATTRAAADTALQNAIDAEALARTNADAAHSASITQEIADRTAADTAEATTRAAADAALDARVQPLEAQVANTVTYGKVVKRDVPAGVIDGVNKVFTTTYAFVLDTEELYMNGQLLDKGADADYTINGQEITLAVAPEGTDKLRVSYFR